MVFSSNQTGSNCTTYSLNPSTPKRRGSLISIVSHSAICSPGVEFVADLTVEATTGKLVLNSEHESISNEIEIGNKALNHIRLSQFGYNVPDTLILEFSFFDVYRKNGKVELENIYYQQIKRKLGAELAIRCSSNFEDDEQQSYAGFFDTFLNVENSYSEFQKHVLRCYKRFAVGDEPNTSIDFGNRLQLAIMVQSMIKPRFSGFLFTSDPVNPPNDSFRVEYWPGKRDTRRMFALTLNKKSGKRIPSNGHADSRLLLSGGLQSDLFNIGKKLDEHYRFPQDAEFVISKADNLLFMLQSRPITAFSYSPDKVRSMVLNDLKEIHRASRDYFNKDAILSNTNISELFVRAVPLGYSIFKYGFAGTKDKIGGISAGRARLGYAPLDPEDQDAFFCTIGDQPRTNLIVDALSFRLPGMEKEQYLSVLVESYLNSVQKDNGVAMYPEDGLYLQSDDASAWRALAGEHGEAWCQQHADFLKKLIEHHVPKQYERAEAFLVENETMYRECLAYKKRAASTANLQTKIHEIVEHLREAFCPRYVIFARLAFLYTHIAKTRLHELKGENDKYSQYSSEQLLNEILRQLDSESEFKGPEYAYFERLLKEGKLTLWEFLDSFQHVGSLDISQPRLGEYSIEELNELFSNNNMSGDSVDISTGEPAFDIDEIVVALDLEQNSDLWPWCMNASRFMRLRERAKFDLLKILYALKSILTELSSRYHLNDLIFYLDIFQVLDLTEKNRTQYRLESLQRKAYFQACSDFKVKEVVTDLQANPFQAQKSVHEGGEDRYRPLPGESIFFGHAEGVCLTATSNKEYLSKLSAYKAEGVEQIIGVFKGVELSYFNLGSLAGFTTENGGYLSHAATIAREFKIPYITGISLDYLQDGDYVILDTENEQIIYRR